MTDPDRARVTMTVTAGAFLGEPDEGFEQEFVLLNDVWEPATPEQRLELLAEFIQGSQAYAVYLTQQLGRLTWVRTDIRILPDPPDAEPS